MSYIDIYRFLENPEACWLRVIEEQEHKYQNTLFPEMKGAYFWKIKITLFCMKKLQLP